MRVRFTRLMCSPTRTAQIGDVVDLPQREAEARIRTGVAVAVDPPPRPRKERTPAETPKDPGGGGDPLEKLTIPDLKALAHERGVDLTGVSRKDELIAAIKNAETSPPEKKSDED